MKITPSIQISIKGIQVERFLNMCTHHSIVLNDIYMDNDVDNNIYYATMNPHSFFVLKTLAKKSGVKIKILSRDGIIFKFAMIKKRKILFVFPFLCLLVLWISSHFLWNVNLAGNSSLTTDMISDYLKNQGIYFGMPLQEIPLKEIKYGLMDTYPQISWISVMLDGTTLNILLNENNTHLDVNSEPFIDKDMRAPISGTVDSVYLRNGSLMVEVGTEVQKGDILISGNVPVLIEHNSETLEKNYIADGDISIVADYPIDEKQYFKHVSNIYTNRSTQKLQLLFNNKSLILPSSHIPYVSYDVYSETIEPPFINIFSIPLQIKLLTFNEYYATEELYSSAEAESLLEKRLNQIIKSLEEKGVQIIEKNVKIESNSVYSHLSGNLHIKVICNKHGILEEHP